ncbi:MAG: bifunctional riboflavin kinase/FAD synthetase [Armatimonadetes bacterium]|nr:bifunctional riboflavin kinase/FAD synthetase [Armatimonadota bacterium]
MSLLPMQVLPHIYKPPSTTSDRNQDLPETLPSVVAIGFFDGVHRGHREIFLKARRVADRLGGLVRIITFLEHPSRFFRPDADFHYLSTVEEKLEILKELGVDVIHLASFDQEVANLGAWDFCKRILVGEMNMRALMVGHDFAMGKNRSGTVAVLTEYGKSLGFEAVPVSAVASDDGYPISSTRIRALVASGDVGLAGNLMGRPYTLSGTMVSGRGLGRQIGFPTLNLEWPSTKILPANGVYATRVDLEGGHFDGVTNVGRRPTVGGEGITVETHVLSQEGTVADALNAVSPAFLSVQFVDRLRSERKFDSVEALADQIRRDIEAARERLE